jgi:hypothetical protein
MHPELVVFSLSGLHINEFSGVSLIFFLVLAESATIAKFRIRIHTNNLVTPAYLVNSYGSGLIIRAGLIFQRTDKSPIDGHEYLRVRIGKITRDASRK